MPWFRKIFHSSKEKTKIGKQAATDHRESLGSASLPLSPEPTENVPLKQPVDTADSRTSSALVEGRDAIGFADSKTSPVHPPEIESFQIPQATPLPKLATQTKIVEITRSETFTPTSPSVDDNFNRRNLERAQIELRAVSQAFDDNFRKFIGTKNVSLVTFDAEIKSALDASGSGTTVQLSAKRFRQQLNKVIQLNTQRSELASQKWYNQVASFVLSLYPAVRLTLGVTSDVAGITGFLPLQVGANGLALIFQLIGQEKDKKDRFLKTLEEIEIQSSRLTSNRHFEAMFNKVEMQERATHLMIAIVNYLNSALSYLCNDSITNVVQSLFGGSTQYQDAEQKLADAIRRYSEALNDFTAECLASDRERRVADLKERRDIEFVQWISSSQWDVEAQLEVLQDGYRGKTTLQWAHKMDSFRLWLRSDLDPECKERVLWIVGPPGVGKSTLAAYLLEFTRALDKSAITVFFFVKSETGGLASPIKILCTLSHQLSLLVPEFRQNLEKLKRAGFVVKAELGIKYLFHRLLLDPLESCKRPIYLILDGVDEVDIKKDPLDPYRESNEILLDCLYSMPSSRLLFLSRPQSLPPENPTRRFSMTSIGLSQNQYDIELYVNQQLSEHPRLRQRFQKAGVDPVKFFLDQSKGIFLWVVLVLRQLTTATGKLFNDFVRGVSDGSMTELYLRIFERFTEEERRWIKEIFYWIIAPKRPLTIKELGCAVQFCLDDDLEDFRDFVLRKCGSLFTRRDDGVDEFVQTVHDTLRAFIMNPTCPRDLHVTVEKAHMHVTYRGLSFLSDPQTETEPLHRYLIREWHYHLVNTTLKDHDDDILCGLYRFFHSVSLRKWVHDDILTHWGSEDTENETPIEKKALRDVHRWLSRYEGNQSAIANDPEILVEALQWRDAAVQDIDELGESVAKATALIWLFDELESKYTIIAAFKLGTGYYWTRKDRGTLSDHEELRQLFDTDFRPLIEWAGGSREEILNDRNLAIARLTLQQWDESHLLKLDMARKSNKELWEDIHEYHCPLHRRESKPAIVSYSADSDATAKDWMVLTSPIAEAAGASDRLDMLRIQVQSDPIAWVPLGTTLRSTGDLGGAIVAYKQAIKSRPYEFKAHEMLAEVYRVLGEYQKSIQTLESCIQQGFEEESYVGLGWSYLRLDKKTAVGYFEKAMELHPHFAPAYKGLSDVYNPGGQSDTMIAIYKKAIETSPNTSFLWSGLGEAYLVKNMVQSSIAAYETAVKKNPRDRWAWTCLGDVYRRNSQYDEAIDAFWTSIQGNPRDSWTWKGLAESYREKGDITRAIAIYTHGLRRLRDYSLFISVGLLFKERGNYDKAIANFAAAIDRASLKRRLLFAYLSNPTSHLLSNYPLVSIDSNLAKSLLWTHMVDSLRARQCTASSSIVHEVEQHGDPDTESAESIVEEAIREYRKALQAPKRNRLLWVYSASRATQGFPPFEQKDDLPHEVLWAMLAEAHKAASQFKEAAEAYEEAIKILPDNKWLITALGEMYERGGEQDRAAEAGLKAEKVTGVYQKRSFEAVCNSQVNVVI